MTLPSARRGSISPAMWSSRSAAKSSATAFSSCTSSSWRRIWRRSLPIGRSDGSRVMCSEKWRASRSHCVVVPAPSTPSMAMSLFIRTRSSWRSPSAGSRWSLRRRTIGARRDSSARRRARRCSRSRFDVGALARVLLARGGEIERAARGDARRHIGELVRDSLVLDDGTPEGLALFGVRERVLERGARQPDRARGDVDAPDLEAAHHLPKAVAGHAADEGVAVDATAVEHQRRGLDALVTELLERLALDERAGGDALLLDDERRQPAGAVAAGARDDEEGVALVRVGDELLGSVEDPAATLLGVGPRARGQVRDVAAALRLGERQ